MGQYSHHQLGAIIHDKGVDFSVWAPFAQSVSLMLSVEFSSKEIPMKADGRGYWTVRGVAAEAGQSYKYEITAADGTKLSKNDPYARQITDSDNGWSVIVSGDFDWQNADAYVPTNHSEAIIYELH